MLPHGNEYIGGHEGTTFYIWKIMPGVALKTSNKSMLLPNIAFMLFPARLLLSIGRSELNYVLPDDYTAFKKGLEEIENMYGDWHERSRAKQEYVSARVTEYQPRLEVCRIHS